MKKILLYIDNLYLGGAQRVMSNLANYFAKEGYDVVLVNEVKPNINKKAYMTNEKIKRVYLEENTVRNFFYRQLKRVYTLRSIIQAERPDVVLSFLGPTNVRMLVATIGLNVKKIVSVRNDPYKEYGKGIKKLFARELFKLADGYVFQTTEVASYFSNHVQKSAKVIYNPVNEVFYKTQRINIKKEIVSIGRLQDQKNPMLLIEAFSIIAKKYRDWKLCFCGEGELQLLLEERCKILGISNQVVFEGQISNVNEKLSSSAIYALSSDYEGMPNALMEAMAVGVPCISTDCPCGGPRELIKNGENGILVPVGDVSKMSEALEALIVKNDYRESLGEAAKLRALNFKFDKILKEWKEYLEK